MTDFSMEELNAAGGWAFPARHTPEHSPGMTLRDYFAAKAVTGLMERWSPSVITSSSEIARFAYLLADAMLAARCSVTSTERCSQFKECEYPKCYCPRHGRCGNADRCEGK